LAIVHHPLDWLADSQRELVEILSDDANLIVTGHWIDSGFGQSELCSASNARATIVSPATDQLELRIINVGFEPLAVDTAAWIWNTETLDWVLIEPRRLQKEPSTSGLRKFDPDSIETLQGPTPRGVEVNPISLPFEIPNFSQTDRQPDFAVLAALPWEMDAFLRHMGSCTEVKCPSPSVRTYYGCTTVTGTSLIVSRALGMGPLHAASLARDVADQWRPRFIILVGIAAGIGKEVRLGDIAVAKQIVNYDPARLTAAGVDRRFEVYRSDPILLDKVIHLRESAWISQLTVRRPDNQLSQTPRVHSGVILSGNAVVADESTADDLQSIWNKAIALEMESGGMATSLHELPNPPGFIVVKGISDFANSQKSDEWQLYAADASAALAAELVRTAI
jgi:nucleoside phosphorylase